jgi:lactoylglutathione lyase
VIAGDGLVAFDPPAGPFYGATPVTITSKIAGATIHYTTDGSTPTESSGMLYAGPVTMEPAVNTNLMALTASNASGVTMLKAVAFTRGGMISEVFTGNYIVIDPLRFGTRTSLVRGLAHIAYNVSSQNWDSVLGFWTKYLGFDTVTTSSGFALVKINDQQFIELYERPITMPQYQLANWGFYVSDAEAFRLQLSKAGVMVPASTTTNALGNLSFATTDPDGHQDEWVQYLPGSVTSRSLGQHMPGTQLFGYLNDYGDATANEAVADAYYNRFDLSGSGLKVYLPNSNCYIEMLTYKTLTQTEAGKHEKAQLVTFRGNDLMTTLQALMTRDPSITQTLSTEGGGSGIPTHNCADVYDADLSRVRMVDINY